MSRTAALNAATVLGLGVEFADAAIVKRQLVMVGAEIPNQLQAVSDAIDALENLLNDHATQSSETKDLVRDARVGLANVLSLAKALRGGK